MCLAIATPHRPKDPRNVVIFELAGPAAELREAQSCLAAAAQESWQQEFFCYCARAAPDRGRSEEHTSELQSLMRISYAVFCLKKTDRSTTLTAITTEHISELQSPI